MTTAFLRAAALAGVAVLTVSGAASAADLYRKAPPATPVAAPVSAYNWTGFYAGANVGGDWLRDELNGSAQTAGSFGGGLQVGYNYQINQFVLGAEADIGYSRPSAEDLVVGGKGVKDWYGTVRARAGFAFDNVLVYGTGGLAWANFKLDDYATPANSSTVRAGWTVGGGLEYAINRNISVKGEYLYADYGTATVGAVENKLSDHLVRVGVNYKF